MSLKLLFEVWGNYKKWDEVTYLYKDREVNSKTTLTALLKNIEPVRSFIITSDTLIENFVNEKNVLAYKDYLEKIKEDIIDFITKSDVDEGKIKPEDIIILPGVGSFEKSLFQGDTNNFYATFYHQASSKIFNIVKDYLNDDNDDIEIYLDITHGINYMTVMVYSALKDICGILAYFYKVKFFVLNSDPRVGSGNARLNINEIERTNITPQLNVYLFHDKKLCKVSKHLPSEYKQEIGKILDGKSIIKKDLKSEYYAFVGSILNGLALFVYIFFPDINRIEENLRNAFGDFYQFIKINPDSESSKLNVSQQLTFTDMFLILHKVLLIAKLLEHKYGVKGEIISLSKMEKTINLSEIEKIKSIYKSFFRIIYQRLNKEIEKIKGCQWTDKYKDYRPEMDKNYIIKNIDERNFFAHCGFGYNIIEIRKHGEEIQIKVKEEFIEEIRDKIYKTFQKELYNGR